MIPANQGMALAQYMIGVLHVVGKGCDKDMETARYWLNAAAEQGETNAIQALESLPEIEENEARIKEEREQQKEEYKKHFKDVKEYSDPMELADMEIADIYTIGEVLNEEE